MESLCTVGSDDRLCTVRVGILSLNTPTHLGTLEQCVIADLLFSFFFPGPRYPASEQRVKENVCVRVPARVCKWTCESYLMLSYPTLCYS